MTLQRPEHKRKRNVVPKVTGLDFDTAKIVLENAGFYRWTHQYTESYDPNHDVVFQDPPDGTLVDTETEIKLNVALSNWVNFLPSAFRQGTDGESNFTRNFLFILQHINQAIDDRLANIHELFDPYTTDPEFVGWLAGWVGLVMAPEWDDQTRRKWVREAPKLYARRGTTACLIHLIKMFTDLDTEIEENRWPYDGFRVGVSGKIGLDSVVTPRINRAHSFLVHLPVSYNDLSTQKLLRLHQVIQMEKPAHTTYFVQFKSKDAHESMQPFMTIGEAPIGVTNPDVATPDTQREERGGQ
jgi:phage tail-like protein